MISDSISMAILRFYIYFYFIRCSINTDDYTSERTDKINSQNKHKILNMYIHCTEKKGDLEFVTLDPSFKLIPAKDWHGTTMLAGSEFQMRIVCGKKLYLK
jgi:hypothetical protein